MITSFLLLACSWSATAGLDDVRVTTTIRATDAVRAVGMLAEQTGKPLKADPGMKADLIVIDVKDAPLDDLMARVAYACSAKWERDGDGWLLTRTKEMVESEREVERKARQAELKRRAALIAKAIAEQKPPSLNGLAFALGDAKTLLDEYGRLQAVAENAKEGANYEAARSRMDQINERLPGPRFVRRMWSILGSELLASADDEPLILATDPNRLERPLPFAALPALDRFLRDYTTFMQASVGRKKEARPAPGDGSPEPEEWLAGGPLAPKLIVTVGRTPMDGVTIDIVILRNAREVAFTFGDAIDLPTVDEPKKLDPKLAATEVSFSPQSRLVMGALGSGKGRKRVPLTGDALQSAIDTEIQDPLSTVPTDILFALGRARETNLIACLPDRLFEAIESGPGPLGRYGSVLQAAYGDALEAKDGVLCLRPLYPCLTRDERVDRKRLSELAHRLAEPKRLTVDEAADWATWVPLKPPSILLAFCEIVANEKSGSDLFLDNLDALRLIGLLSQSQRVYLKSGKAIGGSQLSVHTAAYIDWLTLNRLRVSYIPGRDRNESPERGESLAGWAPTQAMTGGVGPASRMSLELQRNPSIAIGEADLRTQIVSMKVVGECAKRMADLEASAKDAVEKGETESVGRLEAWRRVVEEMKFGVPISQTVWTIHVTFNDSFEVLIGLDDDLRLRDGPISIEQFPSEFLDQFRQGYEGAANRGE